MGILRGSERPSSRMTARFVVLAVSMAAFGMDSSLCQEIPQFQPWPPPTPSETRAGRLRPAERDPGSRASRDDALSPIGPGQRPLPPSRPLPPPSPDVPRSLGDLEARVVANLSSYGCTERRYYGVPGGFAILMRCDRLDCGDSWLKSFLEKVTVVCLTGKRRTHDRVVLLTVTDAQFGPQPRPGTFEELDRQCSASGWLALSERIAHQSYEGGLVCSALAYVFHPGDHRLLTSTEVLEQDVNAVLWGALDKSPCAPR